MRLKSVWIKNFQRIRELLLDLDDSLIVIGGRNDQGKTSALAAIKTAMGGRKATPEEPIRKGAKSAEITLIGDDLSIEWSQARKGMPRLVVKDSEGVVQKSPVTLLAKFLSVLTFRALDFANMDEKQQGEIARRLAGLDFTDGDAKRAKLYAERTDIGRDLKRERAAFEAISPVKDPPESEVSIAKASRELARRREVNQGNDAKREDLENRQAKAGELQAAIGRRREELEEAIADANRRISDLEIQAGENDEALKQSLPIVEALKDEDIAEAQAVIDGADEANNRFRQARDKAAAKEAAAKTDKVYRSLTSKIEAIDEAKTEAIGAAKYPVEGLTVDEDGAALLDGLPFSQAGDAKKLRCSAAIGFAINPDFKMLLIDQGEMLDDENLALLGEIVKEAGGQAIVSRVSRGKECSVIIEDGEVFVDEASADG